MDEVGMRMQYKSKVDLIYEELMDNITSGVYQCGDRLNIRQIAQKNKISEIPVREAIRRLESEGYVTVHANQGATVNEMTDADVMEIFQLKGLLEGYAARLAIDYLTPEDYQKLRQINDELRQAKERNDLDICGELNIQFHTYMYSVLPPNCGRNGALPKPCLSIRRIEARIRCRSMRKSCA